MGLYHPDEFDLERILKQKLTRNDVTYEMSFDTVNPPLLADHVLHDVVVVPGAAYIAMALFAGVHLPKVTPVRLSYVIFPQALVLPDAEKARKVQLIIDSLKTDHASNYALAGAHRGRRDRSRLRDAQGKTTSCRTCGCAT